MLQLLASIVTIGLAVLGLLNAIKLRFRYLLLLLTAFLRTWVIFNALEFVDENVGMCYFDVSVGAWLVIQQLFALFLALACSEFARVTTHTPSLMLF